MEGLGAWYTRTKGPLAEGDSRVKLTPGCNTGRRPDDKARNQSHAEGPWRRGNVLTAQRNQGVTNAEQIKQPQIATKPHNCRPSGLSAAFQAQTLATKGANRWDNIKIPQSLCPNGTIQDSLWNAERPMIVSNKRTVKLRKEEFTRGMIINAPVFHEDSNPTESAGTINASLSAFAHVYGKPRYLIVIGLFATTYQVVPVFSHNGNGLKGKETYEHEFVSINDGRNRGNFEALSDFEPLVTNGKGGILRRDSVVHFVNPISRRYELKIELHGTLLPACTDRLARYIADAAKRGMGI